MDDMMEDSEIVYGMYLPLYIKKDIDIGISRIIGSTEIKSKKKSIKRHNRLVRKEIAIKRFRRRHSGGVKGRFVYINNFLYKLKRTLGDDVAQLEFPSVHEIPVEFAMEKPTDAVKYMIPQYVSEENDE